MTILLVLIVGRRSSSSSAVFRLVPSEPPGDCFHRSTLFYLGKPPPTEDEGPRQEGFGHDAKQVPFGQRRRAEFRNFGTIGSVFPT
jgi:hypothetical protein